VGWGVGGVVKHRLMTVLMGAGGGFLLVFQVGACWGGDGLRLIGVAGMQTNCGSTSNGWWLQG
jgi:hypothetical protein